MLRMPKQHTVFPFLSNICGRPANCITNVVSRTLVNYAVLQRASGKMFYLPRVFTDINMKYQKVDLPCVVLLISP